MPVNSLTNIPQAISSRAITHNFSQEEKNRREEARLNRDFYYSKQRQQIVLVNEDQEPFYINFTYPIVKKKSTMLYSKPLVREWDGPSQSVSYLEKVYEENIIDELLLQADLNSELTGSGIITPTEDENLESKCRLRLYDASSFSALPNEDDPTDLEAISLVRVVDRIPANKNAEVIRVLKQQIWTKNDVLTYEGEVLVNSEPNDLGFIPFANFKGEEVYDQYIGYAPARPVRDLNESINRVLTDLGTIVKFQAFTPLWVSGYSGDSIISLHPGRAINLPAGAEAGVLGVSPNISDLLQLLLWFEEKAYETNSVPKVSVVGGGEAKSGRELIIRWFPLLQVFEEKSVRFQRYEKELANTILKWAGLPEINAVKVNYNAESVLPVGEDEDTLKDDIELNIKTPADEVMRRDATLTEAEAEAIVLANRDFNFELKRPDREAQQEMMDNQNPNESEDEQSTDEENEEEQDSSEDIDSDED